MTVAVWVAVIAAVWIGLAVAVSLWVGKATHRADHQAGLADPAGCPPWCVRERAAALHPTRPAGRHRHHIHHTGRIQHLIARRRTR